VSGANVGCMCRLSGELRRPHLIYHPESHPFQRLSAEPPHPSGYNCMVYDYGSRNKKRGVPRALWYGLEFVRFALNWVWFGESTKAGTSIT
jgi:hypothetical protein